MVALFNSAAFAFTSSPSPSSCSCRINRLSFEIETFLSSHIFLFRFFAHPNFSEINSPKEIQVRAIRADLGTLFFGQLRAVPSLTFGLPAPTTPASVSVSASASASVSARLRSINSE